MFLARLDHFITIIIILFVLFPSTKILLLLLLHHLYLILLGFVYRLVCVKVFDYDFFVLTFLLFHFFHTSFLFFLFSGSVLIRVMVATEMQMVRGECDNENHSYAECYKFQIMSKTKFKQKKIIIKKIEWRIWHVMFPRILNATVNNNNNKKTQ